MKRLVIVIIMFCFGCKTSKIQKTVSTSFYVGTYTNGDSKGIYKYAIDNQGVLSRIGLVAETQNPSFLAKTKDNKTLLAVGEVDNSGNGFVKSYQIQQDTLIYKSKSKSGGAHPCFLAVNANNQVLVANYSGGNIGYLKVDDQNGLTNLLTIQQHYGKGSTKRQTKPHAHSVWFHPNRKEIISVDLGTNELWFSSINNDDKFIPSKQINLKMADGAGPRHLTFHPNKKWIYVLNELNNTISLIKEGDNSYFIDASISMLPTDFKEYSKGADIHISNDGKFLYASNRGHESIVIYKVNEKNGRLRLIDFELVRGKHPRNFSLSPDNKFLLVANKDSNNIVAFKRNSSTGKLTFISEIAAPNPVCILF